jgi:2-hydroxychromene-2-carboxylate isomerase
MNSKIEFYFDFLSPYSYVAWTWVREQNYNFEYIPVSIPSIVAHYETKGPAQIKPKRNYLFKDLLRFTKLNNIAFTTPKNLPFNALYALRLSLLSVAGAEQKRLIDVIYRAGWEKGLDIGDDSLLREILIQEKFSCDDLFSKIEAKEARVELKKNIERAINNEVFGVPTFIVNGELFWGNDSIKYLEMYLKNEDPLDHEKYNAFLNKHTF